MPTLLFVLAFLATTAPADGIAGSVTRDLPEHHAQDETAAVVTPQNLLVSERFWPYQVSLTGTWQPLGRARPLDPGSPGVLIRVEASGMARIDFGRDGLYEIPVAETDLVRNANRVRRGELQKAAPNFVLAIGPRLVDSAAASLRPFPFDAAAREHGFLCVFADPDAPDFAALAASLAPLAEREGVLTILFPQGAHPDAEVRERLRSLKWEVPFVYDHLSEAYTRTLRSKSTPTPALLLQSQEGRVLFQGRWRTDRASETSSLIAEAFGVEAAANSRARP